MFYSDKFGKNQEGIKKTPQLNRPIFGGRLKLRSFLLYQSANDSVTVNLYRITYVKLRYFCLELLCFNALNDFTCVHFVTS